MRDLNLRDAICIGVAAGEIRKLQGYNFSWERPIPILAEIGEIYISAFAPDLTPPPTLSVIGEIYIVED
jgi:hypothetical protein